MSEETNIALVITDNPALAILDGQKFEAFYEAIKEEARKISGDVSTNKGRDEVRSMAFKIAKTRTAIEKARLGLTEEWRTKTAQANTAGKAIKERLEALETDVRKPLTEWEEAEQARKDKVDAAFARLDQSALISSEDTSLSVRLRIDALLAYQHDEAVFLERSVEFAEARDKATAILNAALTRIVQEEADKAELAKLRAAQAEREAEIERLRLAEIEAEAVKQREKDEAARIERLREQAIIETRRVSEQARIDQERKHQAELEAERAKVAKAEAERIAEERRIADQAAQVERERIAREQDREHRAKVMGEAKSAIIEIGVAEAKAREIVLAIAAGNIPNTSIKF